MLTMKKILVAGSSNMDFVLRVADTPRKGETIHSKSFAKLPGGKGANQACACGKLGGDCVFLSVVGRDGLGDVLLDSLRHANVDVSKVLMQEKEPTGMAIITVADDGDNSIVIVPGANGLCGMDYFQANIESLQEADFVMVQLETPAEDIYRLLDLAKKTGKVTVLNPAPAPDCIADAVLRDLDYITPNETELEKLTGMPTDTVEQIAAAAGQLRGRGVRNVLVTMGARGALLCSESGTEIYPTIKVRPVDTTAAGDTFNAGFVVGLADGRTVAEAIRFADTAASISITRPGAQPSIPSRAEVEQFING